MTASNFLQIPTQVLTNQEFSLFAVVSDRARALAMGHAGRAFVEARYTIDRMTRAVEDVYHELQS